MQKTIAILITLGLLSTVTFGDDYSDASAAYGKGEYKKAFKLYSQACDGGSSNGCIMVGAIYEDGIIVKRNINEASAYYSKACDMENQDGCESHTRLQAKLPVCSEDELSFSNDKRYFYVSSGGYSSSILADGKTITIDKKNKIIKVWTVWLATENGRQDYIESLGKYDNYDNFGYRKNLTIINYGNMKNKTDSLTDYNCNGGVIYSNNSKGEWDDIVPGSVMEGITESIVKKYNLK